MEIDNLLPYPEPLIYFQFLPMFYMAQILLKPCFSFNYFIITFKEPVYHFIKIIFIDYRR
jgi:hypothetical protein